MDLTAERAAAKADATPERRGYRPREIARLYGLAPSTVYAAIYRDELRAIRRGRAVIVLAEELDRWLGLSAEGGPHAA